MALKPGALCHGPESPARLRGQQAYEFDASFPAREKAWRSSQELFAMALRAQLV